MKPLGDLYKELISRCEELAADERSGQLMRGAGQLMRAVGQPIKGAGRAAGWMGIGICSLDV